MLYYSLVGGHVIIMYVAILYLSAQVAGQCSPQHNNIIILEIYLLHRFCGYGTASIGLDLKLLI